VIAIKQAIISGLKLKKKTEDNMFSSPILDIAVSLVFTFLLLAIISSAINEWILNSVLKTRSKDLKSAIENLLFDQQWQNIAKEIMNSPFITSLKKNGEKFPSYIPAKNFAMALIGIIKQGTSDPSIAKSVNINSLRTLIDNNSLITGDTHKVISGLIDRAENSFEKFQTGLEQFFDNAMDRTTGWYKRKAKRITFTIALVIAFSLNVDTIQIVKTFWVQPRLAAQMAELAGSNIQSIDTTGGKIKIKESKVTDTDNNTNENIKTIKNVNSLLNQLPIPIGWEEGNYPATIKFDFGGWVSKLIGLLLTAGAVSLGAPFWFDLANKLVNVRNSGSKPEPTSKKIESK